jgi:hypothetical protein
MRSHPLLTVVCAVAATAALVAQNPHVGRWKLNPAKSDFGHITVGYEQAPDGTMTSSFTGQSYTFRVDGREYPAVSDFTVAWTALSPTSWQAVWKLKGKALTTDTLTLSSDGKTLTTTSKGVKPNGEPLDETYVSDRISGSSGLPGQWKTPATASSVPDVVDVSPSGSDGLLFKVGQQTCDAKLDGKYRPCTPTADGMMAAVIKKGPAVLDVTLKVRGEVALTITSTLSADGKTRTDQRVLPSGEKSTAVYERQ